MDIRDFKGEVKYPECGLTSIFELQKELIGPYIKIEGLPQYPIDLNTKSSQILLKDFISRVVEELGEAWESYEIMVDMFQKGQEPRLMIPHLQNYNEEVSDAIHFWAELMIFVGIEPVQIKSYISRRLGTVVFDSLDSMLELGNKILQQDLRHQVNIPAFTVISDSELKDEFLRGGRKLGRQYYQIQKELLWDITYKLQILRNTLKNKPWKQSGMMTDENLFHEYCFDTLEKMAAFFVFTGFTKESLYTIYYKKNQVNRFRQKSKY